MKNTLLITLFGALTLVGSASANVIGPGDMAAPDAFSLSGLTEVASVSGALTAATYTGSYTAAVYAGANSVCASADCLTFLYQVTDSMATGVDGDPGVIEHITASPFSNFITDVGYAVNMPSTSPFTAGTVAPAVISRTLSGNGAVIDWDFSPAAALPPGSTSDILVVETNATNFTPGLLSAQDGSTATVGAYGAATPEPGTIFLLGSGLLAFGIVAKRKRIKT